MKYTGIKCPVCGIPFRDDDDIVVCPDCGAPYHRHCYEKEGKCLFSDIHGTGKHWTPPAENSAPENSNGDEIMCPACGRENPPDALFCSRCGASLHGGNLPPKQPKAGEQNNPYYQNPYGSPNQNNSNQNDPNQNNPNQAPNDSQGYQNPYQNPGYQNPGGPAAPDTQNDSPFQNAPNPFSPITIRSDEPLEDDVTAGDIAKFVQNNASYFLSVFFHKKQTNRNHFSFSAFLFSGGWMLYRKMYRVGAVITGLMVALFILNTFVSLNFSTPLLLQLYEQAGVSTSTYPSYDDLMKVTELVYLLDPGNIFLLFTPLITLLVQGIIMLYCGFSGNRLYYHHCVESIRRLKSEYTISTEYDKALQENGGINISLALCLLICYSIIIYLPNFFS